MGHALFYIVSWGALDASIVTDIVYFKRSAFQPYSSTERGAIVQRSKEQNFNPVVKNIQMYGCLWFPTKVEI